mgnify:CR=1 FL=1
MALSWTNALIAAGSALKVVARAGVGLDNVDVKAATEAGAFDAEIVPMGSAGAKAMAVVRGAAEIYLHSGGQHDEGKFAQFHNLTVFLWF